MSRRPNANTGARLLPTREELEEFAYRNGWAIKHRGEWINLGRQKRPDCRASHAAKEKAGKMQKPSV